MSDWKELTSEMNYDKSIISQGHIDYVRKYKNVSRIKVFCLNFDKSLLKVGWIKGS